MKGQDKSVKELGQGIGVTCEPIKEKKGDREFDSVGRRRGFELEVDYFRMTRSSR